MATVVAKGTLGGAGKDGTPHREPPHRDMDFPWSSSLRGLPAPHRRATQPWQAGRGLRKATQRVYGAQDQAKGDAQGSGPARLRSLALQGYLKDKQLIGSRRLEGRAMCGSRAPSQTSRARVGMGAPGWGGAPSLLQPRFSKGIRIPWAAC